ncbi:recombination-associated protein RdgC [Solimicrobium silvestre]|uniref:Recombination-associated protein RdgC n=1 Tax=Solimicrobium silvestre TaxID=2099400 RepID=A0A2S9GY38_9BURK|nr:recombination-associated protein RdgC [Solimicrobium silvestre]PRC92629.1 DNA recombination-dependent growth factor C [Solimicrobium silvestre]
MWFKNLQVYRVAKSFKAQIPVLNAQLSTHQFQPCGASESASQGWSAPREHGDLVHLVNQQVLLCFTTEKKVLPSSVINAAVKARAQEVEEQQGFKPGRKLLKELKEQVTEELLPRAFASRTNTSVWIDPVNGWLVIDASSPGRSDEVLKLMLKCIDQFPIESLRVNLSPLGAMTDWLSGNEAPDGFTIDQDAELRSSGQSKATVKYTRHNLDPVEIANHIAGGKQCTKLALTWNDKVSFVLTENLAIKRVRALDVLTEKSNAQHEDERLDGDFVLMCGELNGLLNDLVLALGGEAVNQ